MISFPQAKINLGLWVTGKRPDGYHNIESVFYPVDIQDVLEIIPSPDGRFEFASSGIPIPGDYQDNLVVKAYRMMKEKYGLPPVHIHLHKMIPLGSGTGGGSSDAAETIKILNTLFQLKLGILELSDHALAIGSDCPFFIDPSPMLGSGRGEILEPLEFTLIKYNILLVFPGITVSTKEAYAALKPRVHQDSLKALVRLPVESWKDFINNDFEAVIFSKYPQLEALKQLLYQSGAVYASMTGSGSALYAIFDKTVDVSVIPRDYYPYLCPAKE